MLTIPFVVDDHTHIAGLLGFDFFADTVMHIDLERGVVDAIVPASFKPAADPIALPLALDDKTPDVRAKIGGSYGRIVIDTGANRSVFTTAFASRADFSTEGSGNTRFRGVGGTGIAAVHVREFELAGPDDRRAGRRHEADFDAEDVDGTVGTDLIRGYNVPFDYRAGMLHTERPRAELARSDAGRGSCRTGCAARGRQIGNQRAVRRLSRADRLHGMGDQPPALVVEAVRQTDSIRLISCWTALSAISRILAISARIAPKSR